MIIGISGYARSGKDEAAKILVDEFGFRRIAFADKLRDVLYALNPLVDVYWEQVFDYKPQTEAIYVQDVIDKYGWDGYKETGHGDEIRRLLQRLGTEAGRQTLWDSIWVDAAFADVKPNENIVVTDCRFPNEAEAIVQRGGQVWRIDRKGVGPTNSHASETSLDNWDFDVKIRNYGSIEEYHDMIRSRVPR